MDSHQCLQRACLTSSSRGRSRLTRRHLSRDLISSSPTTTYVTSAASSIQQQVKKVLNNNKQNTQQEQQQPIANTFKHLVANSFLVSVRDRRHATPDSIVEHYYHYYQQLYQKYQAHLHDLAVNDDDLTNTNKYNNYNRNHHHYHRTESAKYLNALSQHYRIHNAYQQNIAYYNNLLIALAILFVLFTVLLLLEDNDTSSNRIDSDDSFTNDTTNNNNSNNNNDDEDDDNEQAAAAAAHFHRNLSAISFLLFVTFNLLLIVFTHYSAKQLFRAHSSTFIIV